MLSRERLTGFLLHGEQGASPPTTFAPLNFQKTIENNRNNNPLLQENNGLLSPPPLKETASKEMQTWNKDPDNPRVLKTRVSGLFLIDKVNTN